MKKLLTLSFLAILFSYASYAISPFTPATGVACIGSSIYLRDSLDPGGTWTSSNPSVATISSISASTGMLTGISSGIVTITYTLGSASVTGTFTINPSPAAITGGSTPICVGASTTLACATPGGVWSSGGYYATVSSSTGIVTGVRGGAEYVSYTVSGCSSAKTVTINATTAGRISGPNTVCVGSTITLTDIMGLSGTWTSGNPSVATIGATTGVVTGITAGTVMITYSTTGICGTAITTDTITVSGTTSTGTISGALSVNVGTTITLSSTIPGGTWASGATSIATIGASSGIVNGISVGSAPITYTVTGCSGPASTYTTVNVTTLDGISGYVNFGSGWTYRPLKVWLITYNPTTHSLTAYDSTSLWCTGTSVYYQFNGLPTDSFRVKAALNDTFAVSGYIPTYHDNDFYWHDATVIYHTAGTSDINKNINMTIGVGSSGPGFIAGDVWTGANKGTAGTIPAPNLHVCLVNTTTGQLIQQTYTDAAGHYTFSNLPVGATYHVFPDSLNFTTTAYSSINLTAAAPSMTTAGFTMHTLSKTITPHTQNIKPVQPSASSVTAFPNPANDKLFIKWEETAPETATIVIADVTGRELLSNSFDMNEGPGVNTIDMSSFVNGLYIVTVKTATISYSSKLQVQH